MDFVFLLIKRISPLLLIETLVLGFEILRGRVSRGTFGKINANLEIIPKSMDPKLGKASVMWEKFTDISARAFLFN